MGSIGARRLAVTSGSLRRSACCIWIEGMYSVSLLGYQQVRFPDCQRDVASLSISELNSAAVRGLRLASAGELRLASISGLRLASAGELRSASVGELYPSVCCTSKLPICACVDKMSLAR